MKEPWYSGALADIHDSDYSFLARAAADTAMSKLPPPAESGIVVDLGCGSGVTAEILDKAGYSVVGVDASPDMISIARQRVPTGDFVTASIYEADIPDCQAVLAIGEVFNYQTEDRTDAAVAKLLRQIAASLRPDGFLLCDVAGPGRVTPENAQQVVSGEGWTMRVAVSEDAKGRELTRDIEIDVTNAWIGRTQIAPSTGPTLAHEAHRLQLIEPGAFRSLLIASGLNPEQLLGYAGFDFPLGWSGWLARPSA